MSKTRVVTSSVILNPSTYIGGTFTTYSSNPPNNGLADTASTTYARFTVATTQQYCQYGFNASEIPEDATIDAVTCSVRMSQSYATSMSVHTVQMYADTTAKGTAVTLPNSNGATTAVLTGSTWTREELENVRFRVTGQRRSGGNRTPYLWVAGANLDIKYTATEIVYELSATSSTNLGSITPSGSIDCDPGTSYTFGIGADSLDDIKVEDNGQDVTSMLVESVLEGEVQSTAVSYTKTGSINGSRYTSSIGYTAENPNNQTGNDYAASSGTTASIDYRFDLSEIPTGANIVDVSVFVAGHAESTTNAQESASLQLYSGNTAKGAQSRFTATSVQVVTMSAGTWTYQELQDARLQFTIGYYGGTVQGITFKVTYQKDSDFDKYYTYTISNIQADHNIVVSENIIIPPEEDPDKTYHSLTISSINASTDPGRGTTRLEEGTDQSVLITPLESQITLILDNGVDVSSQLVPIGGDEPTSSVDTVTGASYRFVYTASTGYWTSNNKGQANSAAVSRVNLDLPVPCLVTFTYINYAEATYDYGIFGNIDQALGTTYAVDSNVKLACSSNGDNDPDPQTLSYEVPAGTHFIDIKYRKDQYTDDNNDNLQFKYEITPLESTTKYRYDLTDITTDHSLVFVFGNVVYYFINSSCNGNGRLYPDGQMVSLEGDNHRLTIVPENITDTVTLTDNNIDKTSELERKEITTVKEGVPITVVNYYYNLENIQATHNLVVTTSRASLTFRKNNGVWTVVSAYVKQDGRWIAVSDLSPYVDPEQIYVNSDS